MKLRTLGGEFDSRSPLLDTSIEGLVRWSERSSLDSERYSQGGVEHYYLQVPENGEKVVSPSQFALRMILKPSNRVRDRTPFP